MLGAILVTLALVLFACSPIPKVGAPVSGARAVVSVRDSQAVVNSATIHISKSSNEVASTIAESPRLEWLSPISAGERLETIDERVTIRVRVTAPTAIDLNQIEILVDGSAPGNKADEVSLLKRPEFEDQVLTFQARVPKGEHQVQVVLATSADKRYLVERSFNRDADGVWVLPSTSVVSTTRVIWTKPDVFVLQENEVFSTRQRELEVRFSITSPQPVALSQIRILHNNLYRLPSEKAQLRGENGSYYFLDWITLNENASINDIGLRVDRDQGYALSDRLQVNYSPLRPNLYVLAVGPKLNLAFSDRDAADFAGAFASQGARAHRLFNQVTLDTLTGDRATTQNIRLAIASIENKLRTGVILEEDVVVLFFSTHGFVLNEELYLQANDYLASSARVTSIPYRTGILDYIERLPCRKLVFIDACHAGGARANATDLNQALTDLRQAPDGLAVFASSSADEQSYEDAGWKNGAFTEAILQALVDGRADTGEYGDNNGIITLSELERYVKRQVPEMVKAVKQQRQHPILTRNDLGDLPIYVAD